VYETAASGALAARPTHDGAPLWIRKTAGLYESPVVWRNVVFVTDVTGHLNAFSAADGVPLGRWKVGERAYGRGPSVVEDMLYVAAASTVSAFSLR